MDAKKIISSVTRIRSGASRWTIAGVWKAELCLALVLLASFLLADVWIYRSLMDRRIEEEKLNNVFLLQRPVLIETAQDIAVLENFFKNPPPAPSLIKDPF